MPDRKSGGLTACLKGRDKDLAINVVQEPGRFLLYKEISIGSNTMAPRGYSANPTFSLTGSRSTLELARHNCSYILYNIYTEL